MKKIFFVPVFLFLFSMPGFSEFEHTGGSARAYGMGNAFTGLSGDVYSILYNPAGIASLRQVAAGMNYGSYFSGLSDGSSVSEGFCGVVYPVRLAPGWMQRQFPGVTDWGAFGTSVDYFKTQPLYSETCVIFSYGIPVAKNLSAGINTKLLMKEYSRDIYTENAVDFNGNSYGMDPVFARGGYSKSGIAFDASALYMAGSRVSAGIMLRNFNQPDMGLMETSIVPCDIIAGTAVKLPFITFLCDTKYTSRHYIVSCGAESWFAGGAIGARGGVQSGTGGLLNFTCGLSFQLKNFVRFDYGVMLPQSSLKNTNGTHKANVTVSFGKRKIPLTESMPQAYMDAVSYYKRGEYVSAVENFRNAAASNNSCRDNAQAYIEKIKARSVKIAGGRGSSSGIIYARGVLLFVSDSYDEVLGLWKQYLAAGNKNSEIERYVPKIGEIIRVRQENKIREALQEIQPLVIRREYAKAVEKLKTLNSQYPDNPEVKLSLQDAEDRQRQLVVQQAQLHLTAGLKFYAQGKYGEAVIELKKCLEYDADSIDAKNYLGLAQDAVKEPKKIKQIPVDTIKAEEYYNTALQLYDEGKMKEAVDELNKALKYNPAHKGAAEARQRIQIELR